MTDENLLDYVDDLDANFIEQAEYLGREKFLELATEHPEEDTILKKLMGGGAKLLIGPRGCGKTTLMLKAYYRMIQSNNNAPLPIYVNFKLALKVEPLYTKGSNAPFWFQRWLSIKIFQALHKTFDDHGSLFGQERLPHESHLESCLALIEAGNVENVNLEEYAVERVHNVIEAIAQDNSITRCVLLIDDAAHAFSEKQQEDFFEYFRSIKSSIISPKAAIYPGVTSHSPSFHVGHDAERVDVWVRPRTESYENFMINMALRRFGDSPLEFFEKSRDEVAFLAYAAFGIPRAFLGMIRSIYDSQEKYIGTDGGLQRRHVIELSRQGRDMSRATFAALNAKLPAYQNFIDSGSKVYQQILTSIKRYNSDKLLSDQGVEFGVQVPVPAELRKVFGFLEYSGLIMPAGDAMRGVKGTFDLYEVHIGDLIAENVIVSRRTKSISKFLEVLRSSKHQAWPRMRGETLFEMADLNEASFALTLPQCQACGAERPNESAKFCPNCGSRLKSASTYETLVAQDISVLPLSARIQKRIKENSQIRKVRDILIDTSREQLRGINYIGEVRSRAIISAAEEHVS